MKPVASEANLPTGKRSSGGAGGGGLRAEAGSWGLSVRWTRSDLAPGPGSLGRTGPRLPWPSRETQLGCLWYKGRGETGLGGPREAFLMIIPEKQDFFFPPLQNHTSLSSEKIKLIVSFLNRQLKVSGNVLKCKTIEQTKCGGDGDRQDRFSPRVFFKGIRGRGRRRDAPETETLE